MNNNSDKDDKAKDLDHIIKEIKDDELGKADDTLNIVEADGKKEFSTKDKGEKTEGNKLRQRSIRGEGSMVREINQRLAGIEKLIEEIEQKNILNSTDTYGKIELLGSITEKTGAALLPLIDLEEEIVQTKEKVPEYDQLVKIDKKIKEARKRGATKEAEEEQERAGQQYVEFMLANRVIEPLIEKARKLRIRLLYEKRRLYLLHHSLLQKYLAFLVDEINKRVESSIEENPSYGELVQSIEQWRMTPDFRVNTIEASLSIQEKFTLLEQDTTLLTQLVDQTLIKASENLKRILSLVDLSS